MRGFSGSCHLAEYNHGLLEGRAVWVGRSRWSHRGTLSSPDIRDPNMDLGTSMADLYVDLGVDSAHALRQIITVTPV